MESSKHPKGSLITAALLRISLPVMAADKQNPYKLSSIKKNTTTNMPFFVQNWRGV